jgi:hypothetical protein
LCTEERDALKQQKTTLEEMVKRRQAEMQVTDDGTVANGYGHHVSTSDRQVNRKLPLNLGQYYFSLDIFM